MPRAIEVAEVGDILIVLVLGTALGWLSQRLKFPNAVAQVLLGVLLGAAVLQWVEHGPMLHRLGEVAVVILLGVAGLELGIERLKAAGWAGVMVAMLGLVLSLAGGYAAGWLYGSPPPESVYLSLALAATSIGISVQVLRQFDLIGHRVAEVVIAAAVLDDVVALYLLAAAHGVLSDGLTAAGTLGFIILALVTLAGLYVTVRQLTRWVSQRGWISQPWAQAVWNLSVIFAGALLTHSLDFSAVVGGFFAGVGVSEGLSRDVRERCVRFLEPLLLIAMPFFFVMIGVQAQWGILSDVKVASLVVGLIVIGVVAKAAGGWLGAPRRNGSSERWLTAFSMVSRGEIALVIATLGFEQGHLTHHVFVALVLTAIVLAVLGPLLMAPFAKRLSAEVVVGRDG